MFPWDTLKRAIADHDVTTIRSYLEVGGDPNLTDEGQSLLMVASSYGCIPVLTLLLGKGADVHGEDHAGQTALNWATSNGCVEAMQLLLDHGADPHHTDIYGNAVILSAVHKRNSEPLRCLLAAGADPNIPSNYAMTPLMYAASVRCAEITHLLLRYGAHQHMVGSQDQTVLQIASNRLNLPVVAALLDAGADPRLRNSCDEDAAAVARYSGPGLPNPTADYIEWWRDHALPARSLQLVARRAADPRNAENSRTIQDTQGDLGVLPADLISYIARLAYQTGRPAWSVHSL